MIGREGAIESFIRDDKGAANGSREIIMERTDRTASTLTLPSAAIPAVSAILLGVFLVFGIGFAHPEAIHNAAHDSRHSLAFPCH